MIDLDRVADLELLRLVVKVQDNEIRRLHQKLQELTIQLSANKGKDATAVAEQLRLLQKELDEAYRRTYSQGSERRPRPKSDELEQPTQPQKGHGPKDQPELPIVEVPHELDEADKVWLCTSWSRSSQITFRWSAKYEEWPARD